MSVQPFAHCIKWHGIPGAVSLSPPPPPSCISQKYSPVVVQYLTALLTLLKENCFTIDQCVVRAFQSLPFYGTMGSFIYLGDISSLILKVPQLSGSAQCCIMKRAAYWLLVALDTYPELIDMIWQHIEHAVQIWSCVLNDSEIPFHYIDRA